MLVRPNADSLVFSPERRTSVKRVAAYIKNRRQHVIDPDKGRDADLRGTWKVSQAKAFEQEDGLDYLEAYQWYYRQRAYPHDRMDFSALPRAAVQRDRMSAIRSDESVTGEPAVLTGKWSFVGPTNLSVPYQQYYGQGNITGRVNVAAFDPKVAGTYYIGAAGGGVWVTRDSGTTWTPLGDKWPTLNVSSLAIDPSNNKNIVVGTGDFPGGAGFGAGIMHSVDGGVTWTNPLGNALIITKVLFNPDNPKIVFAATCSGDYSGGNVYRSSDSGATWKALFPANSNIFEDVIVSAPDPQTKARTYYALSEGHGLVTLYKSTDGAQTWSTIPTSFGFSYIATSPTDPKTLYILSNLHIRKSKDGGATFTEITNNFEMGDSIYANYNWSQYGYDTYIACGTRKDSTGKPVDVLYVGLIDIEQSEDAGATWRSLGGPTYNASNSVIHNDQHALAMDPNDPKQLLVGNDGGIYHLNYDPAASTFTLTSLNMNLHITQFYKSAFHPTDPTRLLGGCQDNATPVSTGNLTTWSNVAGGDGGFTAINPTNPNIQYAEAQGLTLFRTANNWQSEAYIAPSNTSGAAFIAPITLDPSQPNLLYAGTTDLLQYTDSTNSWSDLGSVDGNAIQYIAVAPTDSKRIYVATDGGLYVSTQGGNGWTNITAGHPTLPVAAVTGIAVDPNNEDKIVVSLSGSGHDHVWSCANPTATNANRVWLDSGIGLPDASANAVALDAILSQTTYYVGTDVGVFVTQNAGKTWTNATAPLGLPNAQVNDIHVVPGQGFLYAATYGRGIWKIALPAPTYVLQTLTLKSPKVYGGELAVGIVAFNKPAPSAGYKIAMTSSSPKIATVPTLVTIPSGKGHTSFNITTAGVATSTSVVVTGTYAGQTKAVTFTVLPATVNAVQLGSTTVKGGTPVSVTVLFNGITPPTGAQISITTSNAAVASAPGTLFVRGGIGSYKFTSTTKSVNTKTQVVITAKLGGVSQSATLTVTP